MYTRNAYHEEHEELEVYCINYFFMPSITSWFKTRWLNARKIIRGVLNDDLPLCLADMR